MNTLITVLFFIGMLLMLVSGVMAGISLIFLLAKFGIVALVIWVIWKVLFD